MKIDINCTCDEQAEWKVFTINQISRLHRFTIGQSIVLQIRLKIEKATMFYIAFYGKLRLHETVFSSIY